MGMHMPSISQRIDIETEYPNISSSLVAIYPADIRNHSIAVIFKRQISFIHALHGSRKAWHKCTRVVNLYIKYSYLLHLKWDDHLFVYLRIFHMRGPSNAFSEL